MKLLSFCTGNEAIFESFRAQLSSASLSLQHFSNLELTGRELPNLERMASMAPLTHWGQLVCGPPGSGKTTYCAAMHEFLNNAGR